MVVSYSKSLRESFKNVCYKAGVQVHLMWGNKIKDLLMAPKDKDSITYKGVFIYSTIWNVQWSTLTRQVRPLGTDIRNI